MAAPAAQMIEKAIISRTFRLNRDFENCQKRNQGLHLSRADRPPVATPD
jgi:hypothetical protein